MSELTPDLQKATIHLALRCYQIDAIQDRARERKILRITDEVLWTGVSGHQKGAPNTHPDRIAGASRRQ